MAAFAALVLVAEFGSPRLLRVAGALAGPAIGLPWALLCVAMWFHPTRGTISPSSATMRRFPTWMQSATRWYAIVFMAPNHPPMRHIALVLFSWFCLSLAGCQSVPQDEHRQDRAAIEQVVTSFAKALVEKDKSLYMNLFFSDKADEIGWQHVSEDNRLAHIRKSKPDAIKARRTPGNNFISLIDASVAAKEITEEKFHNVRIDTDGEIASVSLDYEFYEAGKRTNWGKEMWQLVRTERGWKIFSVIYTIRDQLSASGT